LDGYLGALGACNCEKAGLLLVDYPSCNENPYELEFVEEFNGDTLNTLDWTVPPGAQGPLTTASTCEYNSFKNVSIKDGTCSIIARKEKVLARSINYRPDSVIM
jgi:hypothetical protein